MFRVGLPVQCYTVVELLPPPFRRSEQYSRVDSTTWESTVVIQFVLSRTVQHVWCTVTGERATFRSRGGRSNRRAEGNTAALQISQGLGKKESHSHKKELG